MFEALDDPTPIAPAPRHHVAVAQRAAELRRRRRAVIALPAVALFLVAMGAGALALRNEPGDSIAMQSTVTDDSDPDEHRAELLAFGGAEVLRDEVANEPDAGAFRRLVSFELTDGSEAFVLRTELTDDQIAALKAPYGAAPSGTTARGRAYYFDPDDPTQVLWFPTDNVSIAVGSSGGADPVALLDQLDYEPPTDRCIDGTTVRTTDACEAFDSLLQGVTD
jgi:hypothetical protein